MGSTSMENATELAGRIIVAYVSKDGIDCVRHMRADAYVGSVVDADDKGAIRDASVSRINGRISLAFTVSLHLGETEEAMNPFSDNFAHFGSQRVMWAAGAVGDGRDCSENLGYHEGDRIVSSLNFPGYSTPCSAEAVESEGLL